jgi:hypothetical protein
MSVAPITFVNLDSVNVSSLTWPLGSGTMFYQDNESLLGSNREFYTTNTVQQVVFSVSENDFFGRSPPNVEYTRAWESLYLPSGSFSFRPVSTSVTLGSLSLYNSHTQLFMASSQTIFNNKESLGQLIVNLLNGPTNNPGNGFPSFTCPCQNESSDNAYCAMGAWNFIAHQIILTLTDKVSSYMSPCMNPGNTMFINEGVGSIFNVSAQVKRIRNLDRVRFRTVNATPKPCNNSVLFQLAAVTCGETERDLCPFNSVSCSRAINTRLGIDFSIQATVLGTNILSSSRLCDNLDPIGANQNCPLEGGQCLEVFLPLMLVNSTLEVPVEPVPATYFSSSFNTLCAAQGSSLSAYIGRFDKSSFSFGLAMSEKPIILYPTESSIIIPDQFKTFVETAIMDAANTVLRNNLDEQLTNAFSPFFQKSFWIAPLMDLLPVCLNFSQTQVTMDCPSTAIVVPPSVCDPCDFCCICYTGGDCGEKCRQRCGCVNTFCAAVDRIEYPIWWKLVVIIFILLAVVMVVLGGFMRGIQR